MDLFLLGGECKCVPRSEVVIVLWREKDGETLYFVPAEFFRGVGNNPLKRQRKDDKNQIYCPRVHEDFRADPRLNILNLVAPFSRGWDGVQRFVHRLSGLSRALAWRATTRRCACEKSLMRLSTMDSFPDEESLKWFLQMILTVPVDVDEFPSLVNEGGLHS